MVTVIGPKEPRVSEAINTTSTSKEAWSRGLSPFYLGPVPLYGNRFSLNMENAWQFTKVYSHQVDKEGNPNHYYWDWAESGWADEKAHRYPMGKGAKPLYSYWDGKKYDYVTARKKIYVPLYRDAVKKTEAFERLKESYDLLGNITLWDFDGYDHRKLGMTYKEVVNDPNRKMGHAFVLALMLEGLIKY